MKISNSMSCLILMRELGVIVTFLAILELVKEALIDVVQSESMSKIYIDEVEVLSENIIECLLLVSDEPINTGQLLKILDNDNYNKKMIEKTIQDLNAKYEGKPIHISKVASGYRFQAKPGMEEYIQSLKIRVLINSRKLLWKQLRSLHTTTSNPW